MMQRIGFKRNLSIANLGKLRFWLGLVVGVHTAFVLAVFFNLSREVLRWQAVEQADLVVYTAEELVFFNVFVAVLSACLGHAVMLWVWMQHRQFGRSRQRRYQQLANSLSLLAFWVVVLVLSRFGSLLPIIVYGIGGYDNDLNLYELYPLLFVLLPVVVFLQSWLGVRLVYRVGWWIWFSAGGVLLVSVLLYVSTQVNQERYNALYFTAYEADFTYLDAELQRVEKAYGIRYETAAVEAMRKYHSHRSMAQVEQVRQAFNKQQSVTLDTIILQKILVHQYKTGYFGDRRYTYFSFWNYATPAQVAEQLQYHAAESPETEELFALLEAMIVLVNDAAAMPASVEHSRRQKYQGRLHPYLIPSGIVYQLLRLRESLLLQEDFAAKAAALPELNEAILNAEAGRLY